MPRAESARGPARLGRPAPTPLSHKRSQAAASGEPRPALQPSSLQRAGKARHGQPPLESRRAGVATSPALPEGKGGGVLCTRLQAAPHGGPHPSKVAHPQWKAFYNPPAPRGRRGDARRGAGTCSPSTAATCAPRRPAPPDSPRHGPRERRFCIPHTQPSPAPAPAPGRRPCLCGPKGAQPARQTCAATAPYPRG